MSITLPRGIQIVKWKTLGQHAKQIRYRVRIVRKNLRADKYFESLDDAKNYLHQSKIKRTPKPEKEIGLSQPPERTVDPAGFIDWKRNPPLHEMLRRFLEKRILARPRTKLATQNYKSMAKAISGTEVCYYRDILDDAVTSEVRPQRGESGIRYEKLGNLRLAQIMPATIEYYIQERMAPHDEKRKACKPSTVARELNLLGSMFNRLRSIDLVLPDTIKSNPVADADKSALEGSWEPRQRRLSKEEEKSLMQVLSKFENPQMRQIVLLALETGMRRGEIVNLRFSQLRDGYIQLGRSDSKTRKARKVPLTKNALKVLKEIQQRDDEDRIFTYSVAGFNSNWQRVVKRANLKDFHFHDLRHEFISRMLELSLSDFATQEFVGISDAKYFETTYLNPRDEIERIKNHGKRPPSLSEIAASAGHSIQMSQDYSITDPKRLAKAAAKAKSKR